MEPEADLQQRLQFWLHLEVSLEFLRDDGSSNLLQILIRDEYSKLKAGLEVDTARDAKKWAMLQYAIQVCESKP